MTDIATVQRKADAVAARFNRIVLKTENAPPSAERVAMLQVAGVYLADLREAAEGCMELTNLPAVEERLRGIEAACRLDGSAELFASLARPARRRLQRTISEAYSD